MKVAFLDRDGVINREVNYLYRIEDFEFVPNSISGMKRLLEHEFKIIIVTNQAGIARGYYTVEDYEVLTEWYLSELNKVGVDIQDVFYCPHHPHGKVREYVVECECRKPNIGLLTQALNKYPIDIDSSIMVGDKSTDVEAGKSFGLSKNYLVRTGHELSKAEEERYQVIDDLLCIPL
jgi:D-glycero-D-manno-heptose 1,7-bisphosphate phosphatase